MKKLIMRAALACAAMLLIGGAALASDTADSIQTPQFLEDYADYVTASNVQSDRFDLAVADSGSAGKEILVFVLNDNSENIVPTADNIVYIDQSSADETGAASFLIFPSELTGGETYYIYLSSDAEAGKFNTLTQVGSFQYGSSGAAGDVTYGDLDGDNNVTVLDAAFVVNAVAGIRELTDNEKTRADVDADGNVTVLDAAAIVNYIAGIRDSLGPKT